MVNGEEAGVEMSDWMRAVWTEREHMLRQEGRGMVGVSVMRGVRGRADGRPRLVGAFRPSGCKREFGVMRDREAIIVVVMASVSG
jgi:hypothetical protein